MVLNTYPNYIYIYIYILYPNTLCKYRLSMALCNGIPSSLKCAKISLFNGIAALSFALSIYTLMALAIFYTFIIYLFEDVIFPWVYQPDYVDWRGYSAVDIISICGEH